MNYTYKPQGVCSSKVDFDIEDGKLKNIRFTGGCPGNLLAISTLLEGMDAEEAARKIQGITCGKKATSCSDQLSKAIFEALDSDQHDK